MTENDYLTVEELALKYKVSKSAIYKLVEKGDLPHFRIGKSIRFDSMAVEKACKDNGVSNDNNK